MCSIIIDTNIIIYYLAGNKKWVNIINKLLDQKCKLYISVITEMELFAWPTLTANEKNKINAILDSVQIINIDSKLARIAGFMRQQAKTRTADSLVAATAKSLDLPLLTNNTKDFNKFKGISVMSDIK
jgi:predicted nucleic acid-binding protein